MLGTAEQIVAGLGAQPKAAAVATETTRNVVKSAGVAARDEVGNAHLRLWIGERHLGACSAYLSAKC